MGWKGGEYKIHSSQKGKKEIKLGHLCPRHGRCSPWLSIFSVDQKTLFFDRYEESFVIFIFCFHHNKNGDLNPSHLKETLLWTWTPSCWLNLGGWVVRIDNQRASIIDQDKQTAPPVHKN